MKITNEMIRSFLTDTFGKEKGNDIVLFPEYSDAFEGMSMTHRAIYNFNKMVVLKSVAAGISTGDAEIVLEKEMRDICKPLGGKGPIINMGTPFIDVEEI